MIIADKILREYRVTEKAANLAANFNQYTFEVAPDANRKEVGRAVAKLFNVEVTNVNILSGSTSLFWRDITFGGNQYTEAIQRELNLSFTQAEALKRGEQGRLQEGHRYT